MAYVILAIVWLWRILVSGDIRVSQSLGPDDDANIWRG